MQRGRAGLYAHLRGFTLVELCIVVAIMAALVLIALSTGAEYATSARDGERNSDSATITEALERYYRTQSISTGVTYPSTATNATTLATFIGEADAIRAPGGSVNSLVIASTAGNQTPTGVQYIYQPLRIDDTLCTSVPCARFKLYYRSEGTDSVVILNSMRQQ